MGSPKPLLDWFGVPLVQSQINSLLAAGVNSVFVVTGHRAYEVRDAINGNRVHTVVNPHYKQGKSTSVKAGLAALPDNIGAIVLLAVDQPRPSWLIKQILASHISAVIALRLSFDSVSAAGAPKIAIHRFEMLRRADCLFLSFL